MHKRLQKHTGGKPHETCHSEEGPGGPDVGIRTHHKTNSRSPWRLASCRGRGLPRRRSRDLLLAMTHDSRCEAMLFNAVARLLSETTKGMPHFSVSGGNATAPGISIPDRAGGACFFLLNYVSFRGILWQRAVRAPPFVRTAAGFHLKRSIPNYISGGSP